MRDSGRVLPTDHIDGKEAGQENEQAKDSGCREHRSREWDMRDPERDAVNRGTRSCRVSSIVRSSGLAGRMEVLRHAGVWHALDGLDN